MLLEWGDVARHDFDVCELRRYGREVAMLRGFDQFRATQRDQGNSSHGQTVLDHALGTSLPLKRSRALDLKHEHLHKILQGGV